MVVARGIIPMIVGLVEGVQVVLTLSSTCSNSLLLWDLP